MPGRPLCRALELKKALAVLLLTAWKEMAGTAAELGRIFGPVLIDALGRVYVPVLASVHGLCPWPCYCIDFLCAHLWSKGQMRLAVL